MLSAQIDAMQAIEQQRGEEEADFYVAEEADFYVAEEDDF